MVGAAGRREATSEISDQHGGLGQEPVSETRSTALGLGSSDIFLPVAPRAGGGAPSPVFSSA